MKIKKGNHIYRGMFWSWLNWQCGLDFELLMSNISYLLPYKDELIIEFPDEYIDYMWMLEHVIENFKENK